MAGSAARSRPELNSPGLSDSELASASAPQPSSAAARPAVAVPGSKARPNMAPVIMSQGRFCLRRRTGNSSLYQAATVYAKALASL